jgi:TRAP-type C4-dicarboxylate transport system permease small subunit
MAEAKPARDAAADGGAEPLIVARDEEVVIEHHPEDWLAFALFWALAFIVFLQFYTRYILNDSLAWTEEIARYGLMWITFIGGAVVVRKRADIAVEVLLHFSPKGLARLLVAAVDAIKLGFLALLAYFSVTITERMGLQTMTVIDVSMSYVYAGVALGCFLMLARQIQCFWRNARDGWRSATEAIGSSVIVD